MQKEIHAWISSNRIDTRVQGRRTLKKEFYGIKYTSASLEKILSNIAQTIQSKVSFASKARKHSFAFRPCPWSQRPERKPIEAWTFLSSACFMHEHFHPCAYFRHEYFCRLLRFTAALGGVNPECSKALPPHRLVHYARLTSQHPINCPRFWLSGGYYCLNMVMITLSTFLAVIVINLYFRGDRRGPVPPRLRRVSDNYRKIFKNYTANLLVVHPSIASVFFSVLKKVKVQNTLLSMLFSVLRFSDTKELSIR